MAERTQELAVSRERYRNVVDNSVEAIAVAQDGYLKFLNPMATILTGFSKEELMAKPFPEFIHPEDREKVIRRHQQRLDIINEIEKKNFK